MIFLGVALAIGAAPGAAAERGAVPPEVYAETICGAIATYHKGTQALLAPLAEASPELAAHPSARTAAAARTALVAQVEGGAKLLDHLLEQAADAGYPKTRDGRGFARAFLELGRESAASVDDVIDRIARIDPSDPARFRKELARLSREIKKTVRRHRQDARSEKVLADAPTVLQPIAVYLTTDASTCPVPEISNV